MAKKTRTDEEEILDFSDGKPHVLGEEVSQTFPIRTCVVSRDKAWNTELLRFVLAPDQSVVPDLKGTLPGRGVWTRRHWSVVQEAVKRNAFPRAFKAKVNVDPGMADKVRDLFKSSMLERLSITKKSGLLVLGTAKIEDSIKRGEIVYLFHAVDASPEGSRKLDRKLAASIDDEADNTSGEIVLTSAEISLATGSANAIHGGLKAGGAAVAFLQAAKRYSDYCAAK